MKFLVCDMAEERRRSQRVTNAVRVNSFLGLGAAVIEEKYTVTEVSGKVAQHLSDLDHNFDSYLRPFAGDYVKLYIDGRINSGEFLDHVVLCRSTTGFDDYE